VAGLMSLLDALDDEPAAGMSSMTLCMKAILLSLVQGPYCTALVRDAAQDACPQRHTAILPIPSASDTQCFWFTAVRTEEPALTACPLTGLQRSLNTLSWTGSAITHLSPSCPAIHPWSTSLSLPQLRLMLMGRYSKSSSLTKTFTKLAALCGWLDCDGSSHGTGNAKRFGMTCE
jgi:hypothetical protein